MILAIGAFDKAKSAVKLPYEQADDIWYDYKRLPLKGDGCQAGRVPAKPCGGPKIRDFRRATRGYAPPRRDGLSRTFPSARLCSYAIVMKLYSRTLKSRSQHFNPHFFLDLTG